MSIRQRCLAGRAQSAATCHPDVSTSRRRRLGRLSPTRYRQSVSRRSRFKSSHPSSDSPCTTALDLLRHFNIASNKIRCLEGMARGKVRPGQINSQIPPAGTLLTASLGTVHLETEPLLQVPSILGLTCQEAGSRLKALDIALLQCVARQGRGNEAPGKIYDQSPAAGTPFSGTGVRALVAPIPPPPPPPPWALMIALGLGATASAVTFYLYKRPRFTLRGEPDVAPAVAIRPSDSTSLESLVSLRGEPGGAQVVIRGPRKTESR